MTLPAFERLLNPGDEMMILHGAACNDHIAWRQIAATNDLVGWTSEGDIGHYWLEPIMIGHNTQPAGHDYRAQTDDTQTHDLTMAQSTAERNTVRLCHG